MTQPNSIEIITPVMARWVILRRGRRTLDYCPLRVTGGHQAMSAPCPFTPENGHCSAPLACPLRATTGLMHRSKKYVTLLPRRRARAASAVHRVSGLGPFRSAHNHSVLSDPGTERPLKALESWGLRKAAERMGMNVGGHGDRLVVILATAAAAALIVVGVLYMLTSERVKPVPKPSAETSQKNGQAPAPGGKLQ